MEEVPQFKHSKKEMNKKGEFELGGLQGLIITIVIIGILLGIGFMVLEEFQEETVDSGSEVWQNVTNATAHTFVNNYARNATLVVRNESDGLVVGTANYTFTSVQATGYLATIVLTGIGNETFGGACHEGSCANFTLSYNYEPAASRSIGETIDAMQNIPTWLGLIIILFIVGILLAIVFTVFPQYGGSPSV